MQHTSITTKRRLQIFMTALAPLLTLCVILAAAGHHGLDVVSLFTEVEKRDAANYVVVTKVFGLVVSSRPAAQADLMEEDAVMLVVKIAVLIGSTIILSGSLLMCYAAVMGKPRSFLQWCDRKLGSVRSAVPSIR
jgi:hypothetical protein